MASSRQVVQPSEERLITTIGKTYFQPKYTEQDSFYLHRPNPDKDPYTSMHSVLPEKLPHMGVHRFSETVNLEQWTKRVQNISEETKKPFEKKMASLRNKVDFLEAAAINLKG